MYLAEKPCNAKESFFIKELNKYNNKIMGQSNIMKYLMQKAA